MELNKAQTSHPCEVSLMDTITTSLAHRAVDSTMLLQTSLTTLGSQILLKVDHKLQTELYIQKINKMEGI